MEQSQKDWLITDLEINGFLLQPRYKTQTIETLFLPLLKKWTALYHQKKRRIVIFLAAPPATGKSTLATFLSYLSKSVDEVENVQALGMDGFHFHQDYILSHTVVRNGEVLPMKTVKGSPESYDFFHLQDKISKLHTEQQLLWPFYDRRLHDVVEEADPVHANIILLEGNYLLLDEDHWRDLSTMADMRIFILADEKDLEQRLIDRKMQGGSSLEEASAHYEKSDHVNVLRTLSHMGQADLYLQLGPDGDYLLYSI